MDNMGFKAPPVPPRALTPNFSQNTPQTPVKEESVKGLYDDNFAADLKLPASVLRTKSMAMISVGILFVGMIFGSVVFGGDSDSKPQQPNNCLTGVVPNPDIKSPLPRCGYAERGQECLMYWMNPSTYEHKAEDFFEELSKLTSVAAYSIQMVNARYAKQIIRPGYIAQIKIPRIR